MRFRLLTYNIHKAIGVDGRFAPERIVALLDHYDADVVLLQEVDRGAPRSSHVDLAAHFARRLEYLHRAVGMNVFLRAGRYGNATLSRFPIGRQRNIDLTIGWRKRRGAQHTRVYLPMPGGERTIDVFNVHLGLSAAERRVQVARLVAAPDFVALGAADACIVAGDMNDWRGLLPRTFASSGGFTCATDCGPRRRRSLKTFPSYAPAGGLDRVFFRGPLRLVHVQRSRMALARVASDHLPVIADFEFTLGAEKQRATAS
jgi:endonuclease/exonuclease/phosphatase family metal-dependent hydrolase